MLDFDVQARGRKCAKTDRLLEPGEAIFSLLVTEGSDVVRHDYAADAWEGPPEDAVGWWKTEVPDHRGGKVTWAPNEVMLHYFEQLEGNAEKEDVRFVLALLMVRRRIFRWEDSDDAGVDADEMTVFCLTTENTYQVRVAQPSPERIDAIQEELAELLFGTT